MRVGSTFNVAFRALRRNKMRSVLTALGIIIGVAAVIAMVGIGNGAKAQVEAQIASLGQNLILIFSGSTTSSGIRTGRAGAGTLKVEEAKAIRRELPGVPAVSEDVSTNTQVAAAHRNSLPLVSGGTSLRIINVQVADANQMSVAQQQIIELLRQRHNIKAGRDDDFTVRNQQEIADAATATTNVMTGLLGAIASVSLVVGGIGIMNIMLVSVTERTREIGTRMAVGARGRDILTQFLIEAISLSSVGGILGIIVGIIAAKTIAVTRHWPALISPGSIVIAFLVSAVVGIFFGFYPARKAAALDPIEALRYE